MKKSAKKVTLCRETLAQLDSLVGGAAGTTNQVGCVWQTGTRCNVSVCICQ